LFIVNASNCFQAAARLSSRVWGGLLSDNQVISIFSSCAAQKRRLRKSDDANGDANG
jgi:hypothetical protein